MDPKARRAVNLSVLRRHDKNIVEIIDGSSHAVVYKFDNQTTSWTKKGVEGTLFVFKRCIQPVYGFIVMNRLGIDNFVAPLTDNMDIELKNTYIMYKTDKDEIHGIWIFEEKDRDRIVNQLLLCCKESKTAIPPPQLVESPQIPNSTTIATSPPQSYGRSIDLLTLFQQAGTKQTNGIHPETTSNGVNHNTTNGTITLRQPTPPSNHVSERDILNELFLKANVNESRKTTPPATSKNLSSTNGQQQLDGKLLLELLRQPATHTPTQQSKSTNNSSNPFLLTPPQKSLSSLPVNSLNYNTNNSSTSFFQKLLDSQSHTTTTSSTLTTTMLPPNLPVYTTKTSSNSLSGEALALSRTQALNVSIASLPKMTRGQQNLVDGISILSRNEFEQRYIRMVQNDPSFMDTLYENYVINVQNTNGRTR
ncbi:4924_t:CDS:2 [Ambispora gerdemannii]|uniref:4924_t:CDS:1 n=1 Tax=Ambispora gerdemannii TaxID=144530 RepID=A0A9N8VI31_9GLOM|nr:4924_t:CDS:2 [Ambispora gerdemannii]